MAREDERKEMNRKDEFKAYQNPYATPWTGTDGAKAGQGKPGATANQNPFKTIWFRPRATIRQIISTNPALHLLLLVALGGITQTLDRASSRNAADSLPLVLVFIIACLLGPLGGMLSLWIGSHLIRLTGSWMGGIGNREHIKAAIVWAAVPGICTLPLWIPKLLLLGSDMFTEASPRHEAQPWLIFAVLPFLLAELVLSVWSYVLICNTIAEVQGFRSAWAGLGNLLLAGMVIFAALIVFLVGVTVLTQL